MADKPADRNTQGTDHVLLTRPRFTEIPSFMRAPVVESFDDLDIAMIGVPMDLGVTNRAGARHGPREIRNASSLMRAYNLSTGIKPYELAPPFDQTGNTALVGASLMYEIMCLLAETVGGRR